MRIRPKLLGLFLPLIASTLLITSPSVAQAAVKQLDFSALSKRADSVVVAKVLGSGSRTVSGRAHAGGLIVTDTRVQVLSVAEGSRAKTITITQPGGVVDGIGLAVDDLPRFSVGEECVLFLDASNNVVGGEQGKLPVADGRIAHYDAPLTSVRSMVEQARKGARFAPSNPRLWPHTTSPSAVSADALAVVPSASVEASAAGSMGLSAAGVVGAAVTPVISSISPGKAIAGIDSVTITGSGFGASQGLGGVDFNDGASPLGGRLPAMITSWSDTRIVCVVPPEGASGLVYVTNGDRVSSYGVYYDTSFSADGMYWANPPAVYRLNDNSATLTGIATPVQAAFDVWNAVSPNFHLVESPTPSTSSAYKPVDDGGVGPNEIYFSAQMPVDGALAENFRWFNNATGEVVKSVIVLNDNLTWGPSANQAAGIYDLETVVLHELGHTAGLLDQYPNTWRVMGAYNGANRRVLTDDEVAGIEYLYAGLSRTTWDGLSTSAGSLSPTVAYGQPVTMQATLRDKNGAPLGVTAAVVQVSADGVIFGDVPDVSPSNPSTGVFTYTATPSSRAYYRFAYKGDVVNGRSYSAAVSITPGVSLSAPIAKSKVKPRKKLTVWGTISPWHSPAEKTVRIKITRKSGKRWVSAGSYWARNYDIPGGTRYALTLKFKAGTYRIYAMAPADAGHAVTGWSAPRKVVVK